MSVLPPKKGSTKRRPGTKGLLLQDIVRGTERSRAWPRKRGTPKSPTVREQNEYFRQAQWAAKLQDSSVQDTITQMVAETPLMPRDLFLMMVAGRAFSFAADDGRISYPMAALQDVSASLDVISQNPGDTLMRGAQFWAGVAPSAIGNSGFKLLDTGGNPSSAGYTAQVGAPTAGLAVTGLGWCTSLLVIGHNITTSTNGQRAVEVSTDNGASYFRTAGNYANIDVNGVQTDGSAFFANSTASNGARTVAGLILGSNTNSEIKLAISMAAAGIGIRLFKANALPINAIRLFNFNAGNLTGGKLYVYGQ